MSNAQHFLPRPIHHFFFEKISAKGFGLMRIGWGLTAMVFWTMQCKDILRYYSDIGFVPPELQHMVVRSAHRFTLLEIFPDPQIVMVLYVLLLLFLFLSTIGWKTRFSIIAAYILLISFHERNVIPLAGGDTVMRMIGFLLMICPNPRAYSLDWYRKHTTSEPSMSIWPYRLLLWQTIVIYFFSAWGKLEGDMWINGTAVAAMLHHVHFFRFSPETATLLTFIVIPATYGSLFFQFGWILLLVPRKLLNILPKNLPTIPLKRTLILTAFLFHGLIFLLMDAGSFSIAMFALLLGLLREDDFAAWKAFWKSSGQPIHILYDGHCRLCQRSIRVLHILDLRQKLIPIDFRDAKSRKTIAPDLSLEDLDRAMHIRTSFGTYFKGFFAFRKLCWQIPCLWPIAPTLYIPGIPFLGQKIYDQIAQRRNICADGACKHT